MRVAIVHDWLTVAGGAEGVLDALLDLYPDASVFTLMYGPRNFRSSPLAHRQVVRSFIDRLPGARTHHRWFAPLFPIAIEQFDLRPFDLVISSTFAVAHGVLTGPDQLHVAYVHRNMQYAWESYQGDLRAFGVDRGLLGLIARPAYHYLRAWDQLAFQRPDVLIANSRYTRRRLEKHYRRTAEVIYPPVSIPEAPNTGVRDGPYLFAGRLVPIKRVDLLVSAFNELRLPLRILGDGPESTRLRDAAGPTVTFEGWRPHSEVLAQMMTARAIMFASEEGFGIAAVEAQAVGTPVIGYRAGGIAETVVDGITGILYGSQTVGSLVTAISSFEASRNDFDPSTLHKHASKFGPDRFASEFTAAVARAFEGLSSGPSRDE